MSPPRKKSTEPAAEPIEPAAETPAAETPAAELPAPETPAEVPAAPAAPAVQLLPDFAPGMKVRHASKHVFEIAEVHPHGIKLAGVANLIDPATLEPID